MIEFEIARCCARRRAWSVRRYELCSRSIGSSLPFESPPRPVTACLDLAVARDALVVGSGRQLAVKSRWVEVKTSNHDVDELDAFRFHRSAELLRTGALCAVRIESDFQLGEASLKVEKVPLPYKPKC